MGNREEFGKQPSSQYMEIYFSFKEGAGTCRNEADKINC